MSGSARDQYFHTLGAGGEATALALGDMQLKSAFEFRQKKFSNAPDRPLSTGLNGSDKLVSLFASKPITAIPDSQLSLEFDYLDEDTLFDYYTNKTYAISGAYRIRYADPTGILRQPVETNFFLYRSWAPYAGGGSVLRHHEQPLRPALALWHRANDADHQRFRDRGVGAARHRIVKRAALSLHQQ